MTDDRSPIARLENRGPRRGAAVTVDAVERGLRRRRQRRLAAGLLVVIGAVVGVGALVVDTAPPETVIVPADNETIDPEETPEATPGSQSTVSVTERSVVPTVIALPRDDAIAMLAASGFAWTIEERANITEAGLVVAQDPAGGTDLDAGGSVTIIVSTGSEQIVMPETEGLTLVDAVSLLTEAGLRVESEITATPTQLVEMGAVIGTEPSAGSLVARGSRVNVVIASGAAATTVPAVVGLFYDTALATLVNTGLIPIAEFRTVPSGDPRVGLVIDQMPTPFTVVEVGDEVVVVVGEAAPEQPG